MPQRGIESGIWTEPKKLKRLPPLGKLLFIYTFSNDHCNQAGLYYISLETISDETGIPIDDLLPLMELLKPNVQWFPEENLLWVRNFINRQTHSHLYLKAVGKSLRSIHDKTIIKRLIDYNREKFDLDLEPYYRDPHFKPEPAPEQKPAKPAKKRGRVEE